MVSAYFCPSSVSPDAKQRGINWASIMNLARITNGIEMGFGIWDLGWDGMGWDFEWVASIIISSWSFSLRRIYEIKQKPLSHSRKLN